MGFFKEVREEFGKVEWSSGKKLANDSTTVFVTIGLFAAFFFAVDWSIQKLLSYLIR